jgi:hypothetical protein
MTADKKNWTLGEIVNLPRKSSMFKSSGQKSYAYLVGSRYICIREAGDGTQGILLKVLGKIPREGINMIGGEPFCKDDKNEGFTDDTYYGHRFPSQKEVKEVLTILQNAPELVEKFEKSSMHINPRSSYWVRDTSRNMLFMKRPQVYDSRTEVLAPADNDSDIHYRLAVVFF